MLSLTLDGRRETQRPDGYAVDSALRGKAAPAFASPVSRLASSSL
jgi:hypothetical protein